MSWIAAGLLLFVGSGLAGAITVARVAERQPVLAVAVAIERGETVTAGHLAVVNIGTDDLLPMVPAADRDLLVGRVATTRLEPGTLLAPGLLTDGPTVPAGTSVVGLALAPGEYPTGSLRPGDQVRVVRIPPSGSTVTVDSGSEGVGPLLLIEAAEVYAVQRLSESAFTIMVSLTIPDSLVGEVAAAAAAGRVRLALAGQP